jgi:hypothetical protein
LSLRNPSQAGHSPPSHCGDSIETAVDELKGPACGIVTKETEKDAKVEKSDYVDEDTNDLDKLRLSKKKPRSCRNMMKAGKSSPGVQSSLIKKLLVKQMKMMKLMIMRLRSVTGYSKLGSALDYKDTLVSLKLS